MRNVPRVSLLAAAVFAAALAGGAAAQTEVGATFVHADAIGAYAPVPADPTGETAPFWTRLGDAQLDALVAQTLAANPDLRTALSRYDAAQALLRNARFDQIPTVTASASAGDARLSADQAPGVARADRDGRTYDAGAQLSWELDLFGRVRHGVAAHRADARASAADFRALQVSLVAETVDTYVRLRGLQEQHRVAEQNARSQAETLDLVERGLAHGRGTEFDAVRARAQLEGTRARVPALDAEIAVAMHRLAVLTGQTPGALIAALSAPAPLPALPAPLDPGTPADLLRRRPDVAAAEARLDAATARIGVARADLFPRLSLGGLFGTQAASRGALFERDSETRLVALGIDWSFLDVGRVRARLAAARADAAGDLAQYQKTVLVALEDTENALVRYGGAREEDGHLQQAANDSATAARLARVRYEAGAGTLLEVLDAERNNLQAQDALAQARTRSLQGMVQLYRALAGGWPERLPERQAVAAN